MTGAGNTSTEQRDIETELLDSAALSGAFEPENLSRRRGRDPNMVRKALMRVALCCDEEQKGGRIWWRMRPEARLRIMEGWTDLGVTARRRFRQRAPRDDFGRAVKCLLPSGTINMADVHDIEKKEEVVAAAGFLLAILPLDMAGPVRDAERAVFDRMVMEFAADQAKDALSGDLVGREREYDALIAYVDQRRFQAPIAEIAAIDDGLPHRMLSIYSESGVGKTAFLTEFLNKRPEDREWTVTLDFERQALIGGDPFSWTNELTRQIGLRAAAMARDLATLREVHAAARAGETDHDSAAAMPIGGYLTDMATIIAKHAPRPLVIVLENFHEVVAADDDDVFFRSPEISLLEAVLSWVHLVTELKGPDGASVFARARTVAALQEMPPNRPIRGRWFEAELNLQSLNVHGGSSLLSAFDADDKLLGKDEARRIAEAVGGHPAHLKTVHRFLGVVAAAERDAATKRRFDIDGFVTVLGAGLQSFYAVDMRTRDVMSKCLYHMASAVPSPPISIADLSRILDVGLPLRVLDVEMIADVLTPVLGLNLSREDAAVVLDMVAEQEWLIKVVNPDPLTVRYRHDIRRGALKSRQNMAGKDEAEARVLSAARGIHLARGDRNEVAYIDAYLGHIDAIAGDVDLAAAVHALALPEMDLFSTEVQAVLAIQSEPGTALSASARKALPPGLQSRAKVSAGVRERARSRVRDMLQVS